MISCIKVIRSTCMPNLAWIQAFLSGRTQPVVLENEKSGTVPAASWVPQGSVLGPIMFLKGTLTLMIRMIYQKGLYKPRILIQVSSKSVEKWRSYGHLMNSIWPAFSRHFEYLISFQIFFNCLIFSYQCYHSVCVSADIMQRYT